MDEVLKALNMTSDALSATHNSNIDNATTASNAAAAAAGGGDEADDALSDEDEDTVSGDCSSSSDAASTSTQTDDADQRLDTDDTPDNCADYTTAAATATDDNVQQSTSCDLHQTTGQSLPPPTSVSTEYLPSTRLDYYHNDHRLLYNGTGMS